MDSWKALPDRFPNLSIYVGICWKSSYVMRQLQQGPNSLEIGNFVGPGPINPQRTWAIFSLDCLLQREWTSPRDSHRFLSERMEFAHDGRIMNSFEVQSGGIRYYRMFLSNSHRVPRHASASAQGKSEDRVNSICYDAPRSRHHLSIYTTSY